MRCFAASALFLLGACASGAAGGPAAMPDRSRVDITTPQGNSISLQETPEVSAVEHVVMAPREQVWQALPEVFKSVGLEAGVVSEPNYVFGNPGLRTRSRLAGERTSNYLDCGMSAAGAPRANTDLLEVSVVTGLEPLGQNSTRVYVQVGGIATEVAGSTRARCMSTGKLEQKLLTELQQRLGARTP